MSFTPGLLFTGSIFAAIQKIEQNQMFCIGYTLTENIESTSQSKILYKVHHTENVENLSKSKVFYRVPPY